MKLFLPGGYRRASSLARARGRDDEAGTATQRHRQGSQRAYHKERRIPNGEATTGVGQRRHGSSGFSFRSDSVLQRIWFQRN
jgi:hypothetical protein